MANSELLWDGIKVFVFGFGGVFINMGILLGILKMVGIIVPAVERRRGKNSKAIPCAKARCAAPLQNLERA